MAREIELWVYLEDTNTKIYIRVLDLNLFEGRGWCNSVR